jgi:hypothetical protein
MINMNKDVVYKRFFFKKTIIKKKHVDFYLFSVFLNYSNQKDRIIYSEIESILNNESKY